MDILLDAIVEFIFTFVFYWPGKVVLRVITLGHYPPSLETHHNQTFVAIIGFVSILFIFITIMHFW